MRSWCVGVVVLMSAAICCASDPAERSMMTIEVLEATDFTEDPMAIEEAGVLEKQARLLQSRVDALRGDPPREPAKQRAHRETIRDVQKERSDVLSAMRLAERRVSAGMCEIYGWDGVKKRVVIIECRGNQRSPARRLSAGMLVECVVEIVDTTPQGLTITRDVLSGVGMSAVQALPPIWHPVPASLLRSVRVVQAPSTTDLTAGIRQELGGDGEPILVAFVHESNRPNTASAVREAVVHVHMLDQNGRRRGQLTKGRGLTVRAARYAIRAPIPDLQPVPVYWITSAANHLGLAVPSGRTNNYPAVRITPPPTAPRGGYEVEIIEAWVRP